MVRHGTAWAWHGPDVPCRLAEPGPKPGQACRAGGTAHWAGLLLGYPVYNFVIDIQVASYYANHEVEVIKISMLQSSMKRGVLTCYSHARYFLHSTRKSLIFKLNVCIVIPYSHSTLYTSV